MLVLGAGLSGLSAAIHLTDAGARFRHVERLGHVGGHAITIEDEGFRFDRTGHLLHLRDPDLAKRVLRWVGDDHLTVQRRSFVFSHGVYTRYPFQANTYGLPPQVAYECLLGFLEAQARTYETPARDFEEYCLRTFGEGIAKHFMLPYNARLWGVHPREITAAWCQRFVPVPRLEDVVAGAVGLNDRELGYNASFVYPRRGIGELPRAMARDTGPVELGRAPSAIDWRARRAIFADEVIAYDTLLSTAPLDVLGRLLVDPPAHVAAAFAKLRKNGLYYLDVALERPPEKDLHWAYVPEESFPFYRVGCYSAFSPALAPEGKASLYVELVDRAPPDEATVIPRVIDALARMSLVRGPEDVRFVRVRHIEHAYVLFDHAYYDALAVIFPFLAEASIVSTGRYGGWNYSSMEDALRFGREAALAALGTPT